jgi:trehalose-phosphatase
MRARRLFGAWTEISKRLRRNRHWCIYLDYDGTLVRLRETRGWAPLPERGRRVLRNLARHRGVQMTIVSGRTVRSVRRQAGVSGIGYIGQHGLEPPTNGTRTSARVRLALSQAKQAVASRVRGLLRIWIQDKGGCFAVHYRGARAAVAREAAEAVRHAVREKPDTLRVLHGKKVLEVLPRRAGKSVAIRESLKRFSKRPLVIFAGDDATDEEVFGALRGDITIQVGSGEETRAKYFLRSPQEMLAFLERLEALL